MKNRRSPPETPEPRAGGLPEWLRGDGEEPEVGLLGRAWQRDLARFVLQGDPEEVFYEGPFASEDTYWRLTALRLSLRIAVSALQDETRRVWLGSIPFLQRVTWPMAQELRGDGRSAAAGLRSPQDILARCNALQVKDAEILRLWRQRFRRTRPTLGAPRIVRLRHRTGLGETETWILSLMVAWMSDMESLSWHTRRSSLETGEVSKILRLSPEDFFPLTRPSHPLARLGLLDLGDTGVLSTIFTREIHIDPPVAKALRGLSLDPEEMSIVPVIIRELVEVESRDGVQVGADEASPGPGDDRPGEDSPPTSAAPPEADSPSTGAALLEEAARPPAVDDPQPESGEPEGGLANARGLDLPVSPFTSDVELVQDKIAAFVARFEWRQAEKEARREKRSFGQTLSPMAEARDKKAKAEVLAAQIRERLAVTARSGEWMPRITLWSEQFGLTPFEADIIILAGALEAFPQVQEMFESGSYPRTEITVGFFKQLLLDDLEEQLAANHFFHKDAPLLRLGFIELHGELSSMNEAGVRTGKGIAEGLLGQSSPVSLAVEGRYNYSPSVLLENVVMAQEHKELILRTIESYPILEANRTAYGMDEAVDYGKGLLMLFYGKPGTGKTMMAEAIATHMKRPIQLANFHQLGGEDFRFLFRRASLNQAILFIDDAEQALRSRELGGSSVTELFTELERFEGICILATNDEGKLDEAVSSRIKLRVKFDAPDPIEQEEIWRVHLPRRMPVEGELDFRALVAEVPLRCGRDIRNAYHVAVSLAIARDSDNPVLCQQDLVEGARQQLGWHLRSGSFSDSITPRKPLAHVVMRERERAKVRSLIDLEKTRSILTGRWGFDPEEGGFANTALFHGPPGTGKSLAALAVGFELGRHVHRVDASQLLSKWVSEAPRNIRRLFQETNGRETILLFDEADSLFASRTAVSSSSDRYANLDSSVLLQEMERHTGVVILTTNAKEEIDPAFRRRIRYLVEFPVPDVQERVELWRRILPEPLPLAEDVRLDELAAQPATGGEIRAAAISASSWAAQRPEAERRVTQADLLRALRAAVEPLSSRAKPGFTVG